MRFSVICFWGVFLACLVLTAVLLYELLNGLVIVIQAVLLFALAAFIAIAVFSEPKTLRKLR